MRHDAEVVAEHHRGLESRPQGEVGLVLLVRHAAPAYLEHVKVIPATRDGTVGKGRDLVQDEEHGTLRAGGDAEGVGNRGTAA